MQCPKCGSAMNQNRFKQPGDTKPDWLCSNTACKNEKGFRTGIWNPKEHTLPPKSQVLPPSMGAAGVPMQPQVVVEEKKSPDETGQQMNRSNLAAAAIRSGRKLDAEFQAELEMYENWVLNRVFIPF